MKKLLSALTLAFVALGVVPFASGQETAKPVASQASVDALKNEARQFAAGLDATLGGVSFAGNETALKRGVTFALFVGREVDEGNPLPTPSFSKEDLESAQTLLRERAGLKSAYLATMTSDSKKFFLKPTRENVLAMLRRVAEEARPEDAIWVVFSGEGFSVDGDAAFAPSVATGDVARWIFESEVRAILASSRANRVATVWLTGRFERRDLKKTERAQTPGVEARDGAERVAIFACSKGERVRESTKARLDFFWSEFAAAAKTTEGFLEGETLRKAFDAASAKVVEATKDSEVGAQTPEWQNF